MNALRTAGKAYEQESVAKESSEVRTVSQEMYTRERGRRDEMRAIVIQTAEVNER